MKTRDAVSHFYVRHHFASSCGPEEVFVQGFFVITVFLACSSSCKSTRCLQWLFEWTSKIENNNNFKPLHISHIERMVLFFGVCFLLQNVMLQKIKMKQLPNSPQQNNPPKAISSCGGWQAWIHWTADYFFQRKESNAIPLHPAGWLRVLRWARLRECRSGAISTPQAMVSTQDITHWFCPVDTTQGISPTLISERDAFPQGAWTGMQSSLHFIRFHSGMLSYVSNAVSTFPGVSVRRWTLFSNRNRSGDKNSMEEKLF